MTTIESRFPSPESRPAPRPTPHAPRPYHFPPFGRRTLGNGVRLPREPGNLLLVAGGVGVAPMVDLAEVAVAQGHQVAAIMGARTSL